MCKAMRIKLTLPKSVVVVKNHYQFEVVYN